MIPRRYKSDKTVSEKAEGSPYLFFSCPTENSRKGSWIEDLRLFWTWACGVSEVELRVYVRKKFGSFPVHAGLLWVKFNDDRQRYKRRCVIGSFMNLPIVVGIILGQPLYRSMFYLVQRDQSPKSQAKSDFSIIETSGWNSLSGPGPRDGHQYCPNFHLCGHF